MHGALGQKQVGRKTSARSIDHTWKKPWLTFVRFRYFIIIIIIIIIIIP